MKVMVKGILQLVSSLLVLPLALCAGFGRFKSGFQCGGHLVALLPGLPGDYVREGYYRWTLHAFGKGSRIQFGSYFAHAEARVGKAVYIGSNCILGKVRIGDRSQIASGVQVLSGRRQHTRDQEMRILGSDSGTFEHVEIGSNCWIGAGAIVMSDVGAETTVGAGSVVVKPLPGGCTAVGSPARIVKSTNSGC